jgi:hypothetical protein
MITAQHHSKCKHRSSGVSLTPAVSTPSAMIPQRHVEDLQGYGNFEMIFGLNGLVVKIAQVENSSEALKGEA